MPRRKAGEPKMERIYLTLRPGDADFLQRLTGQVASSDKSRGPKPSVSGAVRFLIDREAERLRGGDAGDQALLHYLRTGSWPEAWSELLRWAGSIQGPVLASPYKVNVRADGRIEYWVKFVHVPTTLADLVTIASSDLLTGKVPEPSSDFLKTIGLRKVPGSRSKLGVREQRGQNRRRRDQK